MIQWFNSSSFFVVQAAFWLCALFVTIQHVIFLAQKITLTVKKLKWFHNKKQTWHITPLICTYFFACLFVYIEIHPYVFMYLLFIYMYVYMHMYT